LLARTWQGEKPAGIQIELSGLSGLSNVARNRAWLKLLETELPRHAFDGVIGFNKLPGLDVYYGSDPCYVAKTQRLKPAWYRWLPRFHHFSELERSVFSAGRTTQILLLTPHEIPLYQNIYGTEAARFHILPPGITRHEYSETKRMTTRSRLRLEHGWTDSDRLLLLVGSGFRVKGVDRAIQSVAALPPGLRNQTRLAVIGQNAPGEFMALARRLGVHQRVHFLGGRLDVPDWMLAADLYFHPARSESAGMVLLEAIASGLPVLTTDACGYAFHIEKSRAGIVLSSPFDQQLCNRALVEMLTSAMAEQWRVNGLAYAATEDLYSCHERAAEIIEETIRRKLAAK
jgi:UDP-glucose:(heptosyl)LPS alpha-1,3-glucosyltransferase